MGVQGRAGRGVPASGQSVIYAAAAVPQLDTIELDTTHGAEFHDDEAQLTKYRAQLDELESRALSREDSRTFISDLARRL
ncbi:Scr1 family TA system antitoxin-like transcriptional regulator [Streptomyces violascens]|uniref:Scr1 family TA system antitoxin-like transcriptional regulator n=1 Tax=Streptomyces violascens TaxID=67381 RepID=UPI0036CE5761